jgi:hypothetical protein
MDANVLLFSDVQGDEQSITPDKFVLLQNYPNPFNPSTTILFQLPAAAHVQLLIYNMNGQAIRSLMDEPKTPGAHTILWDGTDDLGNAAASGVYTCWLSVRSPEQTTNHTKKMLLIK